MNTQNVDPFASLPVDEEITRAPIEALPALMIQVEGRVVATNLDAFKEAAQTFIANIKTELVNDQDFADADKMVKFLKDGEERLALCKDQAQSQAKSIDELFRTVNAISEQMKTKRLALDKLVKAEKENRRAEIVSEAQQALMGHRAALVQRIGGNWLPPFNRAIFSDAIKGLKSLDSMRDKVAGALANAKIEANAIADTIDSNRKALGRDGEADVWMFLFPDFAQVCTKAPEDFALLVGARMAAEEKRKEEAAKLAAEQAAATINGGTQHGNDGQEQSERGSVASDNQPAGQSPETRGAIHAASTPPIQPASAVCEQHTEASVSPVQRTASAYIAGVIVSEGMIDDFIRMLPICAVEKKALRVNLVKWEKYRIARQVQEAA